MNKNCILFLIVICMFIMTSCVVTEESASISASDQILSSDDNNSNDDKNSIDDEKMISSHTEPDDISNNSDILVAYFSCTNTTEKISEYISDYLNADIYEIVPEIPYTEEDLAYYTDCRADKEQNDPTARPEIADLIENIEQYDTIFIGYPIWHSQAPKIIYTFLESYDFSGKKIIPFCTSHSSGIGSSAENLHSLAADAEWYEGKRFSGDTANSEIEQWIENMDLKVNISDDSHYTLEDICYLQDFLLNRETPDLKNKDYDLNKDNQWDVFDLCLMKQIYMQEHHKSGEFDFDLQTVELNDGNLMPIIGLGTWTLYDETCETAVYSALKDGYRLIDTAKYYGNQKAVGNAVRKAIEDGIVTREEVFVTTKIVPSGNKDYTSIIEQCNEELGLGYIDLMLIHQHGTGEKQLYMDMQDAVKDGIIHSIGISNYYTAEEYDEITADAEIMPAVIQNENHIYYQNSSLQEYVSQYGTIIESYYPFGGRGHTSDSLNNQTIMEIAQTHNKTAAQIILRWHLQNGYIAIPGSSNPEHILENYSIFDFELSNDEIQRINTLNTGLRYENW